MVKTFIHFTLVRCSTVTRCKSPPPSLWSEPSASFSYCTKTRYCRLHCRRCSANIQFSQDRLLMPENRFQLGKRLARSQMALFPAKIGDHDSSQGHLTGIFWEDGHWTGLNIGKNPEPLSWRLHGSSLTIPNKGCCDLPCSPVGDNTCAYLFLQQF